MTRGTGNSATTGAAQQAAGDGIVLDLFAGPGGWSEGLRRLGLREVGIEWDRAACLTAMAAGHARVQADVAQLPTKPMQGKVKKVIGSPPCTLLSGAGHGSARLVMEQVCAAVVDLLNGLDTRSELRAAILPTMLAQREAANAKRLPEKRWSAEKLHAAALQDAYTAALIVEPARYIHDLQPEDVALEQVPEAMPVWLVYKHTLERQGWSVWTGVLNAADYGVPQTREVLQHRQGPARTVRPEHRQCSCGCSGQAMTSPRERVQAFLGLWQRSGPANVIATEVGAALLASDLRALLAAAASTEPTCCDMRWNYNSNEWEHVADCRHDEPVAPTPTIAEKDWQPGDPIHVEPDPRITCAVCDTWWTAEVDTCPECGAGPGQPGKNVAEQTGLAGSDASTSAASHQPAAPTEDAPRRQQCFHCTNPTWPGSRFCRHHTPGSWRAEAGGDTPAEDWLPYGTHFENECGVDGPLTFSDEKGENGQPLRERHDGCTFVASAPPAEQAEPRPIQTSTKENSAMPGTDWKPGDPCAACGSTATTWNPEQGGCCDGCERTDADDD